MAEQDGRGTELRGLVVHEWFASIGGSENVAGAIRQALGSADLLCLWRDSRVEIQGPGRVYESFLARRPFRGRKVLSLPLMPIIWRLTSARSHNSDFAIVSSHLFAHHVALKKGKPKFIYVHTPARYIWEPDHDHRGGGFLVRFASSILKPLDRYRAQEAADLAANSEFVRDRIRNSWGRDARVIYPPVDVDEIRAVSDWSTALSREEEAVLNALPKSFLLGASRFISYKRLDLVIRAGNLSGSPVVIAGGGPEEGPLRDLAMRASVPVHFVLSPSNNLLRALYQRASVYVFPPVEDFGIMPVEAIACGTPVASNTIGGASESVIEGLTGAHFDVDDDESMMNAIRRAQTLKSPKISEYALKFSRKRFQHEIIEWVTEFVGPRLLLDADQNEIQKTG